MDVFGVMSTYNLNSLWNNLNSNSGSVSSVPLVDSVTSAVNEKYTSENYFGQNNSTELQNIYQQVEPDYGVPLTYNQNGDLSIPASSDLSVSGMSASDSNIISLLNSNTSTQDSSLLSVLSQYNSVENGAYKSQINSILSNDPSVMYGTVDALGSSSSQSYGNFLNTTV